MQIIENAFSKDICLFEVSATLTVPAVEKEETELWKKMSSDNKQLIRSKFPLLWKELKIHIEEAQRFELYFIKKNQGAKKLDIKGPARIFIFSSCISAPILPGSIVILDDENLSLDIEQYRNHFIGVVR